MKKTIAFMILFSLLTAVLCGCGGQAQEQGEEKPQPADDLVVVLVTDGENAPIPGVMLQLCDDSLCQMGTTDETGIAEYEAEPGSYTVHVFRAPEGWAEDPTEYPAEPGGMIHIVLQAG